MLPFGWFPNLITHTQQIVSIYGTIYHCKSLFSKMNHTKSMWCLQLLNLHLSDVLLLSTSLFNPDITFFFVIVDNIRYLINKLWLLPCEFSWIFFILLGLWLWVLPKRLGSPVIKWWCLSKSILIFFIDFVSKWQVSEISKPLHMPRQKYLIYGKWC